MDLTGIMRLVEWGVMGDAVEVLLNCGDLKCQNWLRGKWYTIVLKWLVPIIRKVPLTLKQVSLKAYMLPFLSFVQRPLLFSPKHWNGLEDKCVKEYTESHHCPLRDVFTADWTCRNSALCALLNWIVSTPWCQFRHHHSPNKQEANGYSTGQLEIAQPVLFLKLKCKWKPFLALKPKFLNDCIMLCPWCRMVRSVMEIWPVPRGTGKTNGKSATSVPSCANLSTLPCCSGLSVCHWHGVCRCHAVTQAWQTSGTC